MALTVEQLAHSSTVLLTGLRYFEHQHYIYVALLNSELILDNYVRDHVLECVSQMCMCVYVLKSVARRDLIHAQDGRYIHVYIVIDLTDQLVKCVLYIIHNAAMYKAGV